MTRLAIVCPGRGSYVEAAMGTLPAEHPWVREAEELRAELGLTSLLGLDRAERFRAAEHLRPANVSPLIYLISMLDAAEAAERGRTVAVAGNSMGWYTALAVGGALSFRDGLRLVQEMSLLQEQLAGGGQLLYPLVDEEWRIDGERVARVESALASSGGRAQHSIHLGSHAVLAGDDAGIRHLLDALPPVDQGRVRYPLRLVQHGPYHTRFVESVSARARERLADLEFARPRTTLIDGKGRRHTPWSADVRVLRDYTFGAQVTEPYDLASSLRVLLREYAPDRIVLPGPGNTLGGVVGSAVVRERWRGVDGKSAFVRMQAGDSPLVDSMRR
ncbi:MAG: ACP S-malonyltransferase [Planctomycetota bacterium]